jgi:polysaccharide deacetylase family protein (PEP-CTERM system associated)
MTNLLTFDLEDWQPLADQWVSGIHTQASGRVPVQIDLIRRILDRRRVRATFFCLGPTAAAYPQVVQALVQDGHEIASHGYSHTPLHRLTPEAFEADLLRAHAVLTEVSGQPPRGYRAPQFSVTRKTWWALDILAKHGFRYDSSIFPIHHRRYGEPRFSRGICGVATSHGPLVELPLATVSWMGMRLPVAGGGYARLLPGWILQKAVQQLGREKLAFTAYFHPYEYDPDPLTLSITPHGWRRRARCWLFTTLQNLGRCSIPRKLELLLDSGPFGPCMRSLLEAGILA